MNDPVLVFHGTGMLLLLLIVLYLMWKNRTPKKYKTMISTYQKMQCLNPNLKVKIQDDNTQDDQDPKF